MIENKKILITGGTGSLGQELTKQLCMSNKIVIYSRNEERQYNMSQHFNNTNIQFLIGDIRDTETLQNAMQNCDYVIHAAAMKDLIMCEAQTTQTYLNNIVGSKSVIVASSNISSISKVIAVSTDKAASPSNVYGASKYIMEKLFSEADSQSQKAYASVRFGNMIDSKGSLIDIWKKNPDQNIKLTHPEVTRFFFTVKDAAETVLTALKKLKGGEIYIKKMKAAKIYDILRIITKRDQFDIIGLFPGEKIHEDLVSCNEVQYCHDFGDYYVVIPDKQNPNPPAKFSSENAEYFSDRELENLIFNK